MIVKLGSGTIATPLFTVRGKKTRSDYLLLPAIVKVQATIQNRAVLVIVSNTSALHR